MHNFFQQLRLFTSLHLTMPRKPAAAKGFLGMATSSITPPHSPPRQISNSKRQSSRQKASGTKRKALSVSTEPVKRSGLSAASVLEDPADHDASPDSRESENPELDSSDQATQLRQPAVNSELLPLPWKGRLGYAYARTSPI